ncbi:MAG: MATE family efflux transporter [Eubacteriales bacterium]|nr:MATE family efflux transporter [Eubacteriales bacterium]
MNQTRFLKSVEHTFTDRIFLKKALLIAVPIALQNMLNTITNLVDTLMIGRLGSTSIAAVGLANKYFFVFSLFVFGICSGSGILAAQFWGSGDVKNIRKVLGFAAVLALLGAAVFFIPAFLNPRLIMTIFTNSEASIEVGARYLRIACLTYPFIALSNVIVAMMRSINRVKTPVVTSLCAIVINIFLNYCLIFGKLGFPELGVAGAALATLTARIVELICLLAVMYHKKNPLRAHPKELLGWKTAFLKSFLLHASPVIANEFMWGLGTTLYSVAYGRMGDDAVAAITIATTIQDIVIVLWAGLSAATAVILGNELGAGRTERAEDYSVKFFTLSFLLTFVSMAFIFLIRWPIIGMYSIEPSVAEDVSRCILVFIAYMIPKMYNYILIVGVLRSGGDTRMCLFLDTSGVWFLGVPLAFLGALYWKLPIYAVYALVLSEEIYKMTLGTIRYRQKKWLRNIALEVK